MGCGSLRFVHDSNGTHRVKSIVSDPPRFPLELKVALSTVNSPNARLKAIDKYAVIVHEEPEGGYWAEVPALPGCYSQGDTLSELMDNVREAISGA